MTAKPGLCNFFARDRDGREEFVAFANGTVIAGFKSNVLPPRR